MPRTKEFDPDTVLEQAMELFWERGYEATSAQDLVDYTGLSRSSLYNTFGSKQELYLRALDHYRQQDGEMFDHLLERFDSARGAIRHLLEQACPGADEDPQGCFVANATVERAHCDENTRVEACKALSQMQDEFEALVEHGQATGDIPADRDPESTARFLANTYFGLQTTAKLCLPTEVSDDVVDETLRILS